MNVLLDTHALLWALMEPDKLSSKARRLLENQNTDIVVSAASAWEVATKFRLGKLAGARRVVAGWSAALRGLQASELAVTSEHAIKAGTWSVQHRDPFDRMLAAQAQMEALTLVSCDPVMTQFGIKVFW